MKDKILMLIIGILIGAILTAGGFLIFGKNSTNMKMDGDNKDFSSRPNMENRVMDGNMTGTPPNKPDSSSSNVTNGI